MPEFLQKYVYLWAYTKACILIARKTKWNNVGKKYTTDVAGQMTAYPVGNSSFWGLCNPQSARKRVCDHVGGSTENEPSETSFVKAVLCWIWSSVSNSATQLYFTPKIFLVIFKVFFVWFVLFLSKTHRLFLIIFTTSWILAQCGNKHKRARAGWEPAHPIKHSEIGLDSEITILHMKIVTFQQ